MVAVVVLEVAAQVEWETQEAQEYQVAAAAVVIQPMLVLIQQVAQVGKV
jgi:hypothetical protein